MGVRNIINYLLGAPIAKECTTWAHALTQNQTGNLFVYETMLIQLSHTGQG